MGLFDFFKESGEDVLQEDTALSKKTSQVLSQEAAKAIQSFIENQYLGLERLKVTFDAEHSLVILEGIASSHDAAEKAALAAGNIKGIANVENRLEIQAEIQRPVMQYHDVKSGETLSSIAKQYYGDVNQYMKIFEANKPMLSDPNKIYPGQKLRIPD